MRQADEAVYARRNAAVAQEQLIKESELNSEMAVQEKKRQIREAKMIADIAAEKQRRNWSTNVWRIGARMLTQKPIPLMPCLRP